MKNQVISIFVILVSTFAVAQEEIKWSGSVKVWNASASVVSNSGTRTWNTPSSSSGNISLTGKKENLFVVFSTLLPTSYVLDYSSTVGGYLRREDYDIALGYSFIDNLSLLLGYKNLTYKTDGVSTGTMNSSYVGLSGSKLVSDRSFLYGTFTTSLAVNDSQSNYGGDTQDNQRNSMFEIGTGYALTNSTQLTLGYRGQYFVRRYASNNNTASDVIQGLIFGVNHNF